MYRGSVAGPQQAQGGVHRRVMRNTRRPTDLRHPSADRGYERMAVLHGGGRSRPPVVRPGLKSCL